MDVYLVKAVLWAGTLAHAYYAWVVRDSRRWIKITLWLYLAVSWLVAVFLLNTIGYIPDFANLNFFPDGTRSTNANPLIDLFYFVTFPFYGFPILLLYLRVMVA